MHKFKSILFSIPLSVLVVLVSHLVFGFAKLLLYFIFWLLSFVPALDFFVGLFLSSADSSPTMCSVIIAMYASGFLTLLMIESVAKRSLTRKITSMLGGIFLIICNVFFVIACLLAHDNIFENVLFVIQGIIIFCHGKKMEIEDD